MKRTLLAAGFAAFFACSAFAQTAPVGQQRGGAINQSTFDNNSDPVGFNNMSITPAAVALATSTTQATFGADGQVLTGQVITTKATVIATCSGTTGFTLPAVQRYETITIMNRSGGSCLIWPSVGATVETALGTAGATNAPFTMLTNTDVTFRPVTAIRWLQ